MSDDMFGGMGGMLLSNILCWALADSLCGGRRRRRRRPPPAQAAPAPSSPPDYAPGLSRRAAPPPRPVFVKGQCVWEQRDAARREQADRMSQEPPPTSLPAPLPPPLAGDDSLVVACSIPGLASTGPRLPDDHHARSCDYARLGLPPQSDPALVKRHYSALARLLHPDKHMTKSPPERDEFAARFRGVTEARDRLL
jgi:DnaJ-domain-containing protein 1